MALEMETKTHFFFQQIDRRALQIQDEIVKGVSEKFQPQFQRDGYVLLAIDLQLR